MSDWEQACRDSIPEGWFLTLVEPPAFDPDSTVRCLDLCKRNDCGNYGTNWGCAPGWSQHMDVLGGRFDTAILLECSVDGCPSDEDMVERLSREQHRVIRTLVSKLRSYGMDCMGFAGGECGYCGVCSYPDPCRFPEQLVPSVSALGVDMGDYLGSMGRTFEFRDDHVTLYGLILFRS